MRIVKQSTRTKPRLSLILLDWGVRESFHLLHYLQNQTVPRDSFEVLVIEYYSGVSDAVKRFESEIDTWVLLEMPNDCYYHKHLMYNAGILLSQGGILMIGDSDAMVRPAFVETILEAFEDDPLIVYHMDQFRNVRRDLYPFNYPSFDDVLGDGCINHIAGRTKGILDDIDPMHTRNYGACMCARREDVVAIGGADEDPTYLGHVCGPYDMTFRLMNFGRRLVWETEEYLYHTWHPGTDGIDNYMGPHDGRNMSTTAFQALCSGRIPPLAENEAIRRLRTNPELDGGPELDAVLIDPDYSAAFQRQKLAAPEASVAAARPESLFASYRGFDVFCLEGAFYAVPQEISPRDPEQAGWRDDERVIRGDSFTDLRDILDSCEARFLETVGWCNICAVGRRYAVVLHELGAVDFRVQSHRENPRIVWADSLGEARDIAHKLNYPASDNGASADADGVAAQYHPAPPAAHLGFDPMHPPLDTASLERRLAALESGMSGIYGSHTWRTLTWAGGALQSAARVLRLRRG